MAGSKSFFLPAVRGRLFALYHEPASEPRESVLIVPPFAEEMNKTRRIVTLLGERLATQGVGTLVIDLYGTGDSEGDFADADWDTWCEDIRAASLWLADAPGGATSLLGVRLGALLALDAAQRELVTPNKLLLWQPVANGRQHLHQFLRLRVAAALSGNTTRETTRELRAAWSRGETLEVAGYDVNARLASRIEDLELPALAAAVDAQLHWFDILSQLDIESPASARLAGSLSEQGVAFARQCVVGEPFWAQQEISVVPALIDATSRLFQS